MTPWKRGLYGLWAALSSCWIAFVLLISWLHLSRLPEAPTVQEIGRITGQWLIMGVLPALAGFSLLWLGFWSVAWLRRQGSKDV